MTEGVTAEEDTRDLVLIVVGIVANWTIDIHNSNVYKYKNYRFYSFENDFMFMGFWGFGEIGRASCRERVC